MIGRRLLAQIDADFGGPSLFLYGGMRQPSEQRKVLEELRSVGARVRPNSLWNRFKLWWDPNLLPRAQMHVTAVTHARGYQWGLKVDLDRIQDWRVFFSLPPDEVRRRFFTTRPDYVGLEGKASLIEPDSLS